MGYRNREVEIKLQVMSGHSLVQVRDLVEKYVVAKFPNYDEEDDFIVGDASDLYWHAPVGSIGDFVRLRQKTGGSGQVTMKAKDRGNQTDRVEIDVEVEYSQGKALMLGLFNEPIQKVRKRYYVFRLGDEHTTISVYKIRSDERIFIEVEAITTREVFTISDQLANYTALNLSVVQNSIYDIFVCGIEPVLTPLTEFLS